MHRVPVRIQTTARGLVYRKLGAELKIDNELPEGPAESFVQLIVDQPQWIRDLIEFFTFAPDKRKYNQIATIIEDVPKAHDDNGYLIAVSDGSVKHMYQMSFGWVLSTAGGVHLATSYGGCDGRGSSLRAEAVGMLSVSLLLHYWQNTASVLISRIFNYPIT